MAVRKPRTPPEIADVDLIDISGFQPSSLCPHGNDIARGQYCPVCDRVKPRFYRIGHRSPLTDPKPEPRRKYAPGKLKGGCS
jgi:hypothetical protein